MVTTVLHLEALMTQEVANSIRHNFVRMATAVVYDRFARVADRCQLEAFDATANACHRAAQEFKEPALLQGVFAPHRWAMAGAVMGVISGGSVSAVLGLAGATWLSFSGGRFLGYVAGIVGGLAWHAPRYQEALSFLRGYSDMRDNQLSNPEKYALLLDFQRIGQKTAKAANVTARFCAVAGALATLVALTPVPEKAAKPARAPSSKHSITAAVGAISPLPRVLKPVA